MKDQGQESSDMTEVPLGRMPRAGNSSVGFHGVLQVPLQLNPLAQLERLFRLTADVPP